MSDLPPLTDEELSSLFQQACSHHQEGRLPEAKVHYLHLLQYFEIPPLCYNLGLVHYQLDELPEALACFSRAHAGAPDDPDCLFNLALCQKACGHPEEAVVSYCRLLEFDGDNIDALYNLAGCHRVLHHADQAIDLYNRVLALEPNHEAATSNLAYTYQLTGQIDLAIRYYSRLVDLNPSRPGARHMLAALQGETPEDKPAASYISGLFDSFSDHYEHSLVTQLEYSVPALLAELAKGNHGLSNLFCHGLDLGCGTGLSGQAFAAVTKRLDGVDLSPKMLDIARSKQLYHQLASGDIITFLRGTRDRYDLFVAADVFVYLGNLYPVFAAIGRCRLAEACFCFSTENCENDSYILRPSGRFAHAPAYIEQLADETGWRVEHKQEKNLRKERSDWVSGTLWVLRS